EITNRNTGSVLEDIWQRVPRAPKIALAVVQIKPRAQCFFPAPELVSAADDEQVGKPVSIGVEKGSADVICQTVRGDRWLVRRAKGSVPQMIEKCSRL